MQNHNIKILQLDELPKALSLVWEVFNEFEAPSYSIEGINEFKNFININEFRKNLENSNYKIWGYFINTNIVGVIATRQNYHISLLFVNKSYHHQGIARALFNEIIDYYKEDKECKSITVNSSIYAIEVYHHLGFIDIGDEQTVNGIRFKPMKFIMKAPKFDNYLIAPCGVNCGACMAYLRSKNKCNGCNGNDMNKPYHCTKCQIKLCVKRLESNYNFCFQCDKKCLRLKNLDKRYIKNYNISLLKNLENIKEYGIDKHIAQETIKWTCKCGGIISQHHKNCSECGKKY